MWMMAGVVSACTFASLGGCGGDNDGNDCLAVLPPANVAGGATENHTGDFIGTLFRIGATPSFNTCPAATGQAILSAFPTTQGAVPIVFRYDQSGHDIEVPGSAEIFSGCADEDATAQTDASFDSGLTQSSLACALKGNRATLTTNVANGVAALTIPFDIKPDCETCLDECTVQLIFNVVERTVPTPPIVGIELADATRQGMQAAISGATPPPCPSSTPTTVPPTPTPVL